MIFFYYLFYQETRSNTQKNKPAIAYQFFVRK